MVGGDIECIVAGMGWMCFIKDLACDNRQAWVQASLDFPEKKLARK